MNDSIGGISNGTASLSQAWRRHRVAACLVAGLVIACFAAVMLVAGPARPPTLLLACRAQLLLMAIIIPLSLRTAPGWLDALFRAGPALDGFGLAVLLTAIVSDAVTLLQAIKLYLLVAAVGLLAIGVFVLLRTARLARGRCAAAALLTLAGFDLAIFLPLPERINVDLAASDALGLAATTAGWATTALVFIAAAGMVWTAAHLLHQRRR